MEANAGVSSGSSVRLDLLESKMNMTAKHHALQSRTQRFGVIARENVMAQQMGLTAAQANAALDGVQSKIRGVKKIAEFRAIRKELRKAGMDPASILAMIQMIMMLLDAVGPLADKIKQLIDSWRNKK